MPSLKKLLEKHYSPHDIETRLHEALIAAGKDFESLALADLTPVDEFHVRGRRATEELAERLSLSPGMRVLDVGCGLGGPGRYLASEFGCRIYGLDITSAYCRLAARLTAHFGLENQVNYSCADAQAVPFKDASFDIVWVQHVGMNVADKDHLYRELNRVLKPGGLLAAYEIVAGDGEDVCFPVPWARGPEASFLVSAEALRRSIDAARLETIYWRDATSQALEWFRRRSMQAAMAGRMQLGLQVLLGDEFSRMAGNQLRNLEESRIGLVELVARAPAS